MPTIKTSELTGIPLDWAVAMIVENSSKFPIWTDGKPQNDEAYSTDWSKGGPIIEREHISVVQFGGAWKASSIRQSAICGPTPLIAAMRCFVASKRGNTVDIPEEIV